MNQTLKRKQILSGCIALSLMIHAGAIGMLQRNSVWFYSPTHEEVKSSTPWLASIEKERRTEILKEAFEKTDQKQTISNLHTPQSEIEKTSLHLTIPQFTDSISHSLFFPLPPIPTEHLLVSNKEIIPTFHFPNEATFNLLSHLPKDLILPTLRPPVPLTLTPPVFHPEKAVVLQTASPKIEVSTTLPDVAYSETTIVTPDLSEKNLSPPSLHPTLVGSLPKLPTLDELETTSYSEDFDIDLVFLPREEGRGYVFALTLIPRADLNLPKMRQHYMFLIDRANSIQRERLSITKTAISKALEELDPDDTFNIAVFDSKMEKLSATQLPNTQHNIIKAEEFIAKIDLGSFFSPADLYRPLLMTVPSQVQEGEIYTAILLTDGESLIKKGNQKALLQQWTGYNQGRVSLYVLAMEGDRNLASLDTACAFNRGKLITSSTKRGFKRKLLKTMKGIQTPVAKNLSCRAFSRSPGTQIEIYPKNIQTPHLYLGQPYVLIGTTNTLDDFILFVQGRLKDRWLNIKKTISFISAKKGGTSLKSEWALQKVYGLYEQYLKDNKDEHLAEARALLEPLQMQVIFQ